MNNLFKYIIGGLVVKSLCDFFYKEEPLQRRVFISHSWNKGSKGYKSLKKKFNDYDLKIYDHSIPSFKAFDESNKKVLEKKFRNQMAYCSKIFVLANRGIKDTSFVMTEIKIAKEMNKEIIAIKPHGQNGIPNFIRRNSTKIISNNINEIKKVLNDSY